MNTIAAAVLLLSSAASMTRQQTAEVNRLEESLLAPCCYSQSIARHMSAEAEQMRHEVTEMVASGISENEILEHYKALYGERILIVPDGRTGKILFSLPVVAFLVCLGMLFGLLRRMLKAKAHSHSADEGRQPCPNWAAIREEIERETGDGF
jgi:cytochrome c-type biogenesis protein CcmH/NrfF